MSSKVYIAFYHYKKPVTDFNSAIERLIDTVIRACTQSKYSHCELAIAKENDLFDCYSASPRDGGVRAKTMHLPKARWYLVAINTCPKQIKLFYKKHKDKKYDFLGALGFSVHVHSKIRFFCSEFCAQAMGFKQTKISPQQLFNVLKIRRP